LYCQYKEFLVLKINNIKRPSTGFPVFIALLFAIPAFMVNLGIMPYYSDEPTRGVVTLEMMYSGNYITPTFTGEFYYNKPPGYNWILSLFFMAGGGASEWLIRLPAILALACFALSILMFTKKHFGIQNGFLAMLMFLSCGRILFWDSMLGLIDILYSWITFAGFAVVINNIITGNFKRLFLVSWLITAAGFMLKGMPSLAFQGITLLTAFIYTGQFRKLFSPWHFAGASIFLLVTGSYLMLYSQENSLQQYLSVLWDQSSQRTALRKGLHNTLEHLVMFHPKMIYHFIPWSLMALLFIHRPVRNALFGKGILSTEENQTIEYQDIRNQVVRLLFWIFSANIMLYWLSPATIPRYVLMLAPLTFIPLLIFFRDLQFQHLLIYKALKIILFYITPALLIPVFLALPMVPQLKSIPGIMASGIGAAIVMALVLASAFRHRQHHIALLVIVLFTIRIVFNLTWLPVKSEQVAEHRQKTEALQIHKITEGAPLQIIGSTWVDHSTLLYLTAARGEAITRARDTFHASHFYLTNDDRLNRIFEIGRVPYFIHTNTFVKHHIKLDKGIIHLVSFERDFSIQ
jgi:4-amino-4-deoxy-L-arabinose transferase-like glycosyltransferase